MATYGIDLYGKALYGNPRNVVFDASPVVAAQTGYGVLEVSWQTPAQTTTSTLTAGIKNWSRLRLLRNAYGISDAEDDGWIILDNPATTPTTNFLDNTVVPGRRYYYSVWVASTADAYVSTQIYQPGDITGYSGQNYVCLAANTTGVTPGTNAAIWASTPITTPWYRAGACVGLAVGQSGYSDLIYGLIPRPYKVAQVETTASSIAVNDQLQRWSQLFGFYFDVMRAENNALLQGNDIMSCSDRQLALIAAEMGLSDRLPGLPELRRSYIRDATTIQRGRWSTSAIQLLVRDMTGWRSSITPGYNELPDMDAGAFNSPAYPAWNASVAYLTDALSQFADVVTYGGSLYRAVQGSTRYSAYHLATPAHTGTGVPTLVSDPQCAPYTGYLRLLGAAPNDTMTFTFSAPATGAGTYQVFITYLSDPAGGIVQASVNGGATTASFDTYSQARQVMPMVSLGTYALTSTNNHLVLTAFDQNAMSSGYDILVDFWFVQASAAGTNLGIPPTGASNSATFWSAVSSGSIQDTNTMRNRLTDGFSIWNLKTSTAVVNPQPDNARAGTLGLQWWTTAQGPATSGMPQVGNSLAYVIPSGGSAGTTTVFSGGEVQAATWSSTTSYVTGQCVVWNPAGWALPPIYKALVPTLGDQPDITPTRWQLTHLRNTTLPEPALVQTQGIPLAPWPAWSASTAYPQGAIVAADGNLYQAAMPTQGVAPAGYDTDSRQWRWVGPQRQQYTWSLYHYRTSTSTGQTVRPYITWLDAYGNAIAQAMVQSSAQTLFDRFETDALTYPLDTGTTPVGWAVPAAWQEGTSLPWYSDQGLWSTSTGLLYPSSWITPVSPATPLNLMQVGRWLTVNRARDVYSGAVNDVAYVTFMTGPVDPGGNTMEHGLMLRCGSSGYLLASRDRLSSAAIHYTSGQPTGITNTVLATWTALGDGTRMKAVVTASTVVVYAMTGAAPGTWVQLASVSNSDYSTQSGFGVLERIRP